MSSKEKVLKQTIPYQVVVKRSFLGIPKGTVMTFNEVTGTYIRYDGVFETGENFEYDAEHYVELSKDIVINQIDKYFDVKILTKPKIVNKSEKPKISKEFHDKVVEELNKEKEAEEALEDGFKELLDDLDFNDEVRMEESGDLDKTVEQGGEESPEPIKEVGDPAPTQYEGDLVMKCSVCGHVSTISHINEDIAIFMPLNKDAKASFVCPNCGTQLDLYYDNLTPKITDDESPEKGQG